MNMFQVISVHALNLSYTIDGRTQTESTRLPDLKWETNTFKDSSW